MSHIFNDNFLKINEEEIIDKIDVTGFFFENAIKEGYLNNIIM
jgi:hypothetical protein|tara:strand:- start:65 stop:193 length:129 start_codon:yes stop_codon:yes gene_type:complete